MNKASLYPEFYLCCTVTKERKKFVGIKGRKREERKKAVQPSPAYLSAKFPAYFLPYLPAYLPAKFPA